MGFLGDHDLRPLALPEPRGLRPVGLALGKGPNGLEVAIAEITGTPTVGTLRAVWKARHGGRASPVVPVFSHTGSQRSRRVSGRIHHAAGSDGRRGQARDVGLRGVPNGRRRILRHNEASPQVIERRLDYLDDIRHMVGIQRAERGLVEGLKRAIRAAAPRARIHPGVGGGGMTKSGPRDA